MGRVSHPVPEVHTMMARALLSICMTLTLGCLEPPILDGPEDMASDAAETTCPTLARLRELYCNPDWECGMSNPIPPIQGCDLDTEIPCGSCPVGIPCPVHTCL